MIVKILRKFCCKKKKSYDIEKTDDKESTNKLINLNVNIFS